MRHRNFRWQRMSTRMLFKGFPRIKSSVTQMHWPPVICHQRKFPLLLHVLWDSLRLTWGKFLTTVEPFFFHFLARLTMRLTCVLLGTLLMPRRY